MSSDNLLNKALESLNFPQKEAVMHRDSPLLIIAGAGSGKTRVITVRIAYLLSQGFSEHQILAVTFTNKAAGEMRERVRQLLGRDHKVMIRTFHSFGAWMLRCYSAVAGISSDFRIYDDSESIQLMKGIFPDHPKETRTRWARFVSRAKDYGLAPDADLSVVTEKENISEVYHQYQQALAQTGNMDFGDLILRPVQLFRRHPEIQQKIQQRFRVILVDEYQDTNVAQMHLIRLLSDNSTLISVVGDDDQSIYKFRGAEIQNILTFPQKFPNTKVVYLEQNYRSTAAILQLASSVIAQNTQRYPKTLYSTQEDGEKPEIHDFEDDIAESRFVGKLVRELSLQGTTAILYRNNAQSRLFETELTHRNIPYQVIGSLRFWAREEVRDMLAVLALVQNPWDPVALQRVVVKFVRGVGKKSVEKSFDQLGEGDLLDSLLKATPKTRDFVQFIRESRDSLENKGGLKDVMEKVMKTFPLLPDEAIRAEKQENINELIRVGEEYGSGMDALVQFMENASLLSQNIEEVPDISVFLLTMHGTKGLEFDHVIITGLEDNFFPGYGSNVEEERRLFYVALTRAKKKLYLTSCRSRFLYARRQYVQPSRFLAEIPPEWIQNNKPSSQWAEGTRVTHTEYGKGIVVRANNRFSEQVVKVHFDSGMQGEFVVKYAKNLQRV